MYTKRLNFTPDESHLRFAEKREEYQNILKKYRAPEASPAPPPPRTEGVIPAARELISKNSDLILIGVIILLLTDPDSQQDTVLLGILIYLLIG